MKVINNSALIKNVIKDMQAESVVLEACEERYDAQIADIVGHPTYDNTMMTVHRILESSKPERLLQYDQISTDTGTFEMLVGLDTCSYRLPCKTVMGDRDFSITQKRF